MPTQENKCCGGQKQCGNPKKTLSTLFKVVLGLALLVLGGWAILKFWGDLLTMVKGGIGLFLILAGVITLAIAKE